MNPSLLSWKTLLVTLLLLQPRQFGWASESEGIREYAERGLTLWQEPLTGMEFVWLAGGCFKMGQDTGEKLELLKEIASDKYKEFYSDEVPQHEVCLDGFWLGRREVTQGQWLTMQSVDPFPAGRSKDYPAANISWTMAQQFIATLNQKSSPNSFRLPTEAEWEYAARGGTTTPFYTGKIITTDLANFNGSFTFGKGGKGLYRAAPLPAGSLPANPFGLFDMAGNLWEWCADHYSPDYYTASPPQNPTGPEQGTQMVMRGGSWFTAPRTLRSANRRGIHPEDTIEDCGFRLVSNRPAPNLNKVLLDQNF